MRVGIDIRPLEGRKTGIGAYVEGLIGGLKGLNVDHQFVLFASQPFKNVDLGSRFQVKVIPSSPLWHLQVAKIVKSEKMIYHATHSLLDAVILKKRCILTVHDLTGLSHSGMHTMKVRAINKLFFKTAINGVGRIITPTQNVRDELIKYIPQVSGKTTVIYEAVEDDFGTKVDKNHLTQLDLKPGYILFNSTLEPRKNVPRLVHAYSLLKNPPPLVLAGKKGWGFNEIDKTITELGLHSRVKILDWVSDAQLQTLYHFASIFVYPSISEGFGLSPLKAFKVGVPTLVSDLPVFNEVLGEAALKVDPLDIKSIAVGMSLLLTNDVKRQSLINSGYDRLEKYSWGKTAQETLANYQKLNEHL